MQTKIENKFTQANYEKIASLIEIDLQEYFKIIEAETLELLKKVEEGITENELNKEIDILFGRE